MNKRLKAIVTAVLLIVVSLVIDELGSGELDQDHAGRQLLTYQTSSTRMNLNKGLCAGVDRASIFSQDEISQNKDYVAQLKSSVSIDGNSTVNTFFDDTSQGPSILMANLNGLIMFVGPFALGLALVCICCPVFMCCCCCPDCCPPACCRKADDELYSRCELYWPTIVLLLALSLSAAGSAFGFSKASAFGKGISNMACSLSMIPDDLLNGNVTDDGKSYFSGLNMLNTNLIALNGAPLTTLNTAIANFQSTATDMSAALTQLTNLLTAIKLSDNNAGAGVPSLGYTSIVGSQPSIFRGVFGSWSTGGVVKTYYDGVNQFKTQLALMAANADAYMAASAALGPALTATTTIIGPLVSLASNLDFQADLGSFPQQSTSGLQMYYGGVLAVIVIAFLGTICMTFCSMYKCRYLIYFACILMLLVAGLGFFLSTLFSTMLPVMSWTCDFLDAALTDQPNFSYNLRQIDSSVVTMLSSCMPFGNGDLLTAMGVTGLAPLTGIGSVMTVLNSFDVVNITSQITGGANLLAQTVSDYGFGIKPDIADTSFLSFVANPANYPTCTDVNFALDSYIPSISQNPSYVSCATPGNNADEVSCNVALTSFAPKSGTCFGCLDVSRIFMAVPPVGAGTTIANAIMARYGANPGCSTFAGDIGNLWDGYYKPRQILLTGVGTAVGTAAAQATLVNTKITTLGVTLGVANGNLSPLGYLIDPTYGTLGGLNCRVLGEDVERLTNSLCVSLFNSFYSLRISLGITAIGFLISLFCIVCTGPRHYRQSEKLNKVRPQQESFQTQPKREMISIENLTTTEQ